MYLGSLDIDALLTFPANTHRFDTGAGTDADSVPSYRVYEDETGTAILNGSMAKLDDANTVGFYSEQLTISAANGFERGKSYTVYISAVVNSVTATMSHTFGVDYSRSALKTLIDLLPEATDFLDAAALRAAVGLATANLDTQLGDLPTNAELATSQAAADDATLAAIAALNNLSSAGAQSAADAALVANHLDHLLAVTYDPASKPGAADALLNELVESDAGVARYTANALEQAPSAGGGLDAAGVRTAVGLAAANLDTQLSTIDTVVDAILVDTGTTLDGRIPAALVSGRMDASVGAMAANTLTASALQADAVDEILDETIGDGAVTFRQALRVFYAVLAGKVSGAETTEITFRNGADTGNVIVATVTADGNRTTVTVTP